MSKWLNLALSVVHKSVSSRMICVCIAVIGDEILKGHVKDSNSHFLCQGLWEMGVKVCRTVVVPDQLDAIATEVRTLSALHDFVLTSGGVGPTHDDITMEGERGKSPYHIPPDH